MSVFKNSLDHHPGQLVVEAELAFDEVLDGDKNGLDYGEGNNSGALGGRDGYQKGGSLSSQNLVRDRGMTILACGGIMKDSALLF